MVNETVRPLLALALQTLDQAKRLFVYRLIAHAIALGFTMLAAYSLSEKSEEDQTAVEIGAAAIGILFELIAFALHHRAAELHTAGRMMMRRVMLLDALGPDAAPSTLQHHFDASARQRAEALVHQDKQRPTGSILPTYYWSSKDPGQARLRDHLFESATFSHRLYVAAWQFSLICMVVMIFIGAPILVFAVAAGSGGESTRLARVMIAVVAFLPACQELDHMLLYRMVGHQLGALVKRVEALYAEPLKEDQPNGRLFADFGDYCAATTFAPPIRNFVYKYLGPNIAAQHLDKMRQLGQL